MHIYNLYRINSVYDADLMDIVKSFIASVGLPAVSEIYDEVAKKCLSLLQPSIKSWQSEGLLVLGEHNTLVKSPLFQKVWDRALQLYPKKRLSIVSTGQEYPAGDVDNVKAYYKDVALPNEMHLKDQFTKKVQPPFNRR
jgi:hypothetical protein